MSLPPAGALELGGQLTPLQRGSLTVCKARELLVDRPIRNVGYRMLTGAFEPDGAIARDTLCFKGGTVPERDNMPRGLVDEEVVHVDDEEVVWGGQILPHYGHFLCESVSRLWPLLPGGELEGLPVVFTTGEQGRPKLFDLPFVRDWLDAFGVRRVELPERGTVRFTRMFVPEPALRMKSWIAPEIRDIHLHARRGMDVPPGSQSDVLWLSRSGLGRHRVPYDEALLEWLLGSRVTIVNPETMPLAEQIGALEGSRAIAGVIGSAFHTLLMTADPPDSLYLCPPWDKAEYPAQHRFLEANASFAAALAVAAWTHRTRESGMLFPGGYRLLIPETLRALSATVLPLLLEDPRIAAFAQPECHWPGGGGWPSENDLDAAVARVLLEPLSIQARMRLGALFEAEGLDRCALEQFLMVADLSEDHVDGPLRAAQILARDRCCPRP